MVSVLLLDCAGKGSKQTARQVESLSDIFLESIVSSMSRNSDLSFLVLLSIHPKFSIRYGPTILGSRTTVAFDVREACARAPLIHTAVRY